MQITKPELLAAANGIVPPEQIEALWGQLERSAETKPKFDFIHVSYYWGALIVIGAMGWFMDMAWERFGGSGLMVLALSYAVLFLLAARTLLATPSMRIPGGLFVTMAVCMTPLAIYGFERMTGLWPQGDPGAYRNFHPQVNASWIAMELGTIAAAYIAIRFVRFPFLAAPLAFALWFLSMDLTPLMFGDSWVSWEQRQWVSLWFGLAMVLSAFLIDRRSKNDYAFWLYLFGMLAFWGSLSSMSGGSEFGKAMYCLINVALMVIAVLLQRRVFLICGAFGITGYIGHLAHSVFQDSILFPFALTLIGIFVIFMGVTCRRHRQAIEGFIMGRVPSAIRARLPEARTPPT